jgi:hypothetical protein
MRLPPLCRSPATSMPPGSTIMMAMITPISAGNGAPGGAQRYAACARSSRMSSIFAIFGRRFFAACHRS